MKNIFAVLLLVQLATFAFGAAGDLDPAFASNGSLLQKIGPSSYADDVAIQPDGKLLVAGQTCSSFDCDLFIARFSSRGEPDPAFGTNGVVRVSTGEWSSDSAIALAPGGKIVVAGNLWDASAWLESRTTRSENRDA